MINATVKINKILYSKEDFNIMKVDFITYESEEPCPTTDNIVVGNFNMVDIDDTLKITGYWTDKIKTSDGRMMKNKYGYQFSVETYERIIPQSVKSLKRYIKKFGGKGIGEGTITKIVDIYGLEAINIIKQDVQNLIDIGIKEDKANQIRNNIIKNEDLENCFIQLMVFNLTLKQIMKIFKVYGSSSSKTIRENPYLLRECGVSFKRCDNISVDLGISRDIRIKESVLYYLFYENTDNGNLFTYKYDIYTNLNSFLNERSYINENNINKEEIDNAINSLKDNKKISVETKYGEELIYIKYFLYVENQIVDYLTEKINEKCDIIPIDKITKNIKKFENEYHFKFAEKQKDAITMALRNRVSILTGGPGTGKTQTINAIIYTIKNCNPSALIGLCAPTGKAAKRMTQLTGLGSYTIHKKFGLTVGDEPENPILCKDNYLIIDESSMIDAFLFLKVLENVSENTSILLVGDHEQLPSVGAGLIFRDLIKSEVVETTVLDEIFRQSEDSNIALNSNKIVKGLKELKFGDDFKFIKKDRKEDVKKEIINVMEELLLNGYKYDEIQVLSPMRIGDCGTVELNRIMQEKFNSKSEKKEEISFGLRTFRENDRVIQIKNNYDYDIFNGSIGIIKNIGSTVEIDFDDKTVRYDNEQLGENIELANALTIHKSQGSEFKVVMIPVHASTSLLNSRNLIYTGITRAREMVILIGQEQELYNSIDKIEITKRNSQIIDKLKEALS